MTQQSSGQRANALFHVGLTVTDLERSLRFYQDVAGFQLSRRTQVSGEWLDNLFNLKAVRLDVAQLELEGLSLQLVQHLQGSPQSLTLKHNHVGTPHLSIYVGDVHSQLQKAQAHGVTTTSDIVTLGAGNTHSFYVTDPDGVPVEFIARLNP